MRTKPLSVAAHLSPPLLALLGAFAAEPAAQASTKPSPRQVRFALIDHRKNEGRYYVESAKLFKNIVESKTGGRYAVTLMDLETLSKVTREGGEIAAKKLANGEIEIANLRSDIIGEVFDRRLNVFDLPYLIKDYAHAQRIVEGPVGRRLVERLPKHGFQSLAFTYSGGFRILVSRKPVSVSGLRGLKVTMAPVGPHIEQYKAWGAVPLPTTKEDFADIVLRDEADAMEASWNCYDSKPDIKRRLPYVTEMGNNFYVTLILASSKFLDSLPAQDREVFAAAAKEAAAFERRITIEGNDKVRAAHIKSGRSVTFMKEEDRKTLAEASKPVLETFADAIGRDVVAEVLAEASGSASSKSAAFGDVRTAWR
ncbi:MAG: TRAP transporter substrate-binding protein [Elusimicrobia bacterium]|nr:TRAP transporter substrate-binding protein [Elusimicrobiota bacterium]